MPLAAIQNAAAQPHEQREVRVFAVAYRHDIARHLSYELFRAVLAEQFDARIRPYLRSDATNLVVYPEAVGLAASFTGSRGTPARQLLASGHAVEDAFAALAVAYAPQVAYYEQLFPGVDAPGQLLRLALTDTMTRSIVETFSRLADHYGVYLSVSADIANFERTEGAEAILLRDPEAATEYAYVATSAEVHNRNLIFGPDGGLIELHSKIYLDLNERRRDSLGLGGLSAPELDGVSVADLPFARVGTVLGRDARMPDITDRLEQLQAEILLQPSAHGPWTEPGFDIWPPDKFQRGGWWATQKSPGIFAAVGSMLTGNLGERGFDGQAHVVVAAPKGGPTLCLLGQSPDRGWLAVGPWSDLSEPVSDTCAVGRRDAFRDLGVALGPRSDGPRQNAYADGVIFADLTLPAVPEPASRVSPAGFDSSGVIPGAAAQFAPDLTAAVDGAWLAWVDFRRGQNQSVFVARTSDGSSWTDPVAADPWAVRPHDKADGQWGPSIVVPVGGDSEIAAGLSVNPVSDPLVAFVGFPLESWDVGSVSSTDGGAEWQAARRVDDADRIAGHTRDRTHSAARAVAWPDGDFAIVWSDLRRPYVKPQVRIAYSEDGGHTWSSSVRPDGLPSEPSEENQLGPRDSGESRGQAFPALATVGDEGLLLAWQELSESGVPSVYAARSSDRGASFESPVQLGGAAAAAWRPALGASGDQVWLAWEEETAAGGRRVALRRSADGGASWDHRIVLDESGPAGAVQRYANIVPLDDGQAIVVYEDNRAGDSDVLGLTIGAHGKPSPPVRLDDGPDGTHARVPTAARLHQDRIIVAWQDTRDDVERIRVAVGPPPSGAPIDVSAVDEPPPAPEAPEVAAAPAPLPTTGGGALLAGFALLLGALTLRTRDRV